MPEQTISVQTSKFCTLQVSVSVTIHVFGVPVNNQNSVVCYNLSVVRGLSIGPADDTQAPWDILDDSVSNRIILSIGIFGVVLLIIIETTGEYCLPTQFPSYPHFIFFIIAQDPFVVKTLFSSGVFQSTERALVT